MITAQLSIIINLTGVFFSTLSLSEHGHSFNAPPAPSWFVVKNDNGLTTVVTRFDIGRIAETE